MCSDGIKQIVSENIDKHNYHAWSFILTNFLMGKGYWEIIKGKHKKAPDVPTKNAAVEQQKAFKDWN